ncbi:unnamed protein product [Psylliodes chrysocephalus]|uniref:Uncharacterized protein n=1 Tax=Psylliodes chrysocephalus TaxID=3402493 RepID=A0A9P0GDH5_9CUCU|nr:unnamed protein product [Psylliodes chrysocephala]
MAKPIWHEAIVSRWAPKHDLDVLQLLNICPDINVKKSAFTVYLLDTNVGLAFLDERISQIEKENMTKHLESKPPNKKEIKRLDGENLAFKEKDLSHFITGKSEMFFKLFGIHNVTEYCSDSLRSQVDDTAERGIALIKQFNESVRDEQQKQFLLRVVKSRK